MNKKIVGIFVCMLVILSSISVIGLPNYTQKQKNDDITRTLFGKAWIEKNDDYALLYLNGSNYEMGYQYGTLASDMILQNYRAIMNTLESFGITYTDLVNMWNIQKEYTPQEYIDELQGIADGSGIDFEKICVMQIIDMFYRCCGAAAWGSATSDGKLIHLRSFDYDPNIKDPETGKYMQENQVLIVRDPDNGYASLSPVFAGLCGSLGGINEQQIAIGQMTSETYYKQDVNKEGTPMEFRIRYALDHTASYEDAIEVLNANRTVGWNFIVSDGEEPIGYVLEQTANFSYYGTYDDPVESTKPFFSIDHVVRRTNLFVSPQCAATQRKYYSPEPFAFIRYLLFKLVKLQPNFFAEYTHYNTLSKELEDHWGSLDLYTTMELLRDIYNFKTDYFWWTVLKEFFEITANHRVYPSLHQWVACPETGDMVISFADADTLASENTMYQFNLYDLPGS